MQFANALPAGTVTDVTGFDSLASGVDVSDFAGAMCRFSFIFLFLFIPRAPLCGKSASCFEASLSTLWSLSESPHVVEPNAAPSQDI